MRRLHLFFPENDIWLSRGAVRNYTPPAAATALRRAAQTLPMWYASPGDVFVCEGVNARWFDEMLSTFDLDVGLYDTADKLDGVEPMPWGWSWGSRAALSRAGVDAALLPDDDTLARWRRLSHRRTSIAFAARLKQICPNVCGESAELYDESGVRAWVDLHGGDVVLKAPWSSTGRGLIFSRHIPAAETMRRAAGVIHRQGSVIAQEYIDHTADFALLFDAGRYVGLSLFDNDNHGGYVCGVVADDDALAARLGFDVDALAAASQQVLDELIWPYYRGPLGIDMMLCADGRVAVCEINLRYTMGRVAHELAHRVLAPGVWGRLRIAPRATADTGRYATHGRRLVAGVVELLPPGAAFSISLYSGNMARNSSSPSSGMPSEAAFSAFDGPILSPASI